MITKETTESSVLQWARGVTDQPVSQSHLAADGRFQVDGKFFARGGKRWRIQGVTYGPFAPSGAGDFFPSASVVQDDFTRMVHAGINAIRTYHLPPAWLLHQAEEHRLAVFLDLPWRKHLCFLDSADAQHEAREAVRRAAELGRQHPCVLAYSVGNEIPPNIVRWHGRRKVERFLAELADSARQIDPKALLSYTGYPPTEYLELPFLDFATFNVYLHDLETFRRYLLRLHNLVGEKPLLLGELGMDTLRNGELEQARFLSGHLRAAVLAGLAGAFVFSWTDDWHTGGCAVQDWAFGITHANRLPKATYHSLREQFAATPAQLLTSTPRVSVVVCTYNGARTLDQCLQSLGALDYPDYEIIVVDDGSTDGTAAIVSGYPQVRAIHQPNQGLSAARNVGLREATGTIVAYTDDDCFADRDWLTLLVAHLQRTDAAGVGGPNLTPEDGRLAACVGAAPGQPMHVLESDQVAEHIPGCNMAFRREALLAIKGFDPAYKKAGDDVDLCWRLQQAGYWITFAPGAFVWHHRRQNARTYFRQQAGYGEAEALLRFKHPDRFNGRGDGKWRGMVYGPSLQGLCFSDAIIYQGTFATGLFQCIYQPGPAHWAMLPSTLEWHLLIVLVGLGAMFWPWAWLGVAGMLLLSLAVALLQGFQAHLPSRHGNFRSRLLISAFCYAQPLVRSWARYRTRFFAYRPPVADNVRHIDPALALPLTGTRTVAYWSEDGCDRLNLLGCVVLYLNEQRWGKTVDSGWSEWDLEIYCHPWTVVQVCTAQEDHGAGKYLIRVCYRLRASGYLQTLATMSAGLGLVGAVLLSWPLAAVAGACLGLFLGLWWRGTRKACLAIGLLDKWAAELSMIRHEGFLAARATPGDTDPPPGLFRRLLWRVRKLLGRSKPTDSSSREAEAFAGASQNGRGSMDPRIGL